MNAAKWIKLPVLLSLEEMQELIDQLAPFQLFRVGAVLPAGTGEVTQAQFLSDYNLYLQSVQKGDKPNVAPFGLVMTRDPNTIGRQVVTGGREIIRPTYPSIQLQPHDFQFDPSTLACRSMVYGVNSIPWGIQFSYPHLFEEPKTRVIETVDGRFVNTALFKALQQFIRNKTRPTPMTFEGKKFNVPIRLGKGCFEWISTYPWTQQRGLHVASA